MEELIYKIFYGQKLIYLFIFVMILSLLYIKYFYVNCNNKLLKNKTTAKIAFDKNFDYMHYDNGLIYNRKSEK